MKTTETVVVLTRLTDVTADLVIKALNQREMNVVRLDPTEALTRGVEFGAAIGGGPTWCGALTTPTRRVEWEQVAAVYYRRPSPWRYDHPDPQTREFVQTEARHGLGGLLYNLPHARYVNHPAAVSRAEFKPAQLHTASQVGFNVPATLITNDPDQAHVWARRNAPVVYKPLRGLPPSPDGRAGAIWAQRIDPDSIDHAVGVTAHLFQAEVPKVADARVTVVDGRVSAWAITTPERSLDWRRGDWDRLKHRPLTVPPPITDALLAYLRHFGLVFGCFDFALTGSGTRPDHWWYMECHANGQWGWLPDSAEIAAAFAMALARPAERSPV